MIKQWVIPDIHGCLQTLKQLIEVQIQPKKTDELYFLGDYINRGPDSKGVLDYLMILQNSKIKTRFLIGNHEKYLLKAYKAEKVLKRNSLITNNDAMSEWLAHGGDNFLDSYGLKYLNEVPKNYIKWLKSLERFIFLKKYILVHAGFNFNNEDPFQDKKAMLWIRNFKVDPKRINHRIIIHGHVPKHLKAIKQNLQNKDAQTIDLDNGIYMSDKKGYGNLIAFELNTKKTIIQENLDL